MPTDHAKPEGSEVKNLRETLAQVKAQLESATPGDLNFDGVIDIGDITLLIEHLMYLKAADYNNDGKIDEKDVAQMLQDQFGGASFKK